MCAPTWRELFMPSTAIDIHTHVVPATFPAYADSLLNSRWPQMAMGHDCRHRNVMIDGRLFRTVTDECWEVDRRMEVMERAGVARQVLSPMPELLSYWFTDRDALTMGRYVNDVIAAMVTRAPARFIGFGMVPMQNPDLAARELGNLIRLGPLRGVEIGTNINGIPIGDARFEQFFATAEELGAAIFVHALHPTGHDRIIGSPQLANFVGFPCETSFAISSLMTGGILKRHPRLRLAFSHGGGAFALVLARLEQGCRIASEVAAAIGAAPRELARRLFYDTLVYHGQALRFLADSFGVSQLCIGTDFPFDIQEHRPLDALAGYSACQRRMLESENALRFLGEPV
jgi:aminocarboxymuconate-semialdehyde decarboxylase